MCLNKMSNVQLGWRFVYIRTWPSKACGEFLNFPNVFL